MKGESKPEFSVSGCDCGCVCGGWGIGRWLRRDGGDESVREMS